MLLTKDLVKVRIKDDRAFPVFLNEDLAKARDLAGTMIDIGERLSGATLEDFKEALDLEADTTLPYYKGMLKVFLESSASDDPDDLSEKRRDYLILSEELRKSCSGDIEKFRSMIAERTGKSFEEISASLYADLPDFSLITMPSSISAASILGKYNRALLRGLMLSSNAIDIEISGDLAQVRKLLRASKFHRLILESLDIGEKVSRFRISGPLALGSHNIAYGSRLSSFVNHVIDLPSWKLNTEVEVRSMSLKLEVISGKAFFGAPETHDAYIPEEFKSLVGQHPFQKESVEIKNNTKFLTISNSIVIPDFFVHSKEKGFFIELIHKWHQSSAIKSLSSLAELKKNGLVLAIDKSLTKEPKVQKLIEKARSENIPVLEFREFPTIRSILEIFTNFPNYSLLKPGWPSADN